MKTTVLQIYYRKWDKSHISTLASCLSFWTPFSIVTSSCLCKWFQRQVLSPRSMDSAAFFGVLQDFSPINNVHRALLCKDFTSTYNTQHQQQYYKGCPPTLIKECLEIWKTGCYQNCSRKGMGSCYRINLFKTEMNLEYNLHLCKLNKSSQMYCYEKSSTFFLKTTNIHVTQFSFCCFDLIAVSHSINHFFYVERWK